ncbi:MAG: hypothetical protein HXY44_09395 [Syntrophaceae bacterium]|nr:hypothetical protein [Syntrophaceae bacterium]
MTAIRRFCKFHRNNETNQFRTGYCDLDGEQTDCEGYIDLCGKTDSLKRYLFAQMKKEGGLKWEVRRNVPFLGNLKTSASAKE